MGLYDRIVNPNEVNLNSGHRYVRIQAQDASGSWTGACQVPMTSAGGIRSEMEAMKRQYPESRIRAIDEMGNIVDFLP